MSNKKNTSNKEDSFLKKIAVSLLSPLVDTLVYLYVLFHTYGSVLSHLAEGKLIEASQAFLYAVGVTVYTPIIIGMKIVATLAALCMKPCELIYESSLKFFVKERKKSANEDKAQKQQKISLTNKLLKFSTSSIAYSFDFHEAKELKKHISKKTKKLTESVTSKKKKKSH